VPTGEQPDYRWAWRCEHERGIRPRLVSNSASTPSVGIVPSDSICAVAGAVELRPRLFRTAYVVWAVEVNSSCRFEYYDLLFIVLSAGDSRGFGTDAGNLFHQELDVFVCRPVICDRRPDGEFSVQFRIRWHGDSGCMKTMK
jgi:hypothetical protein